MQIETQCNSNPPSTQGSTFPSAFSEAFHADLRRLARLAREAAEHEEGAAPETQSEALLAGPLGVVPVERAPRRPGHAVVDANRCAGPVAVCDRRAEALRLAVALPLAATPRLHHLAEKPGHHGFTLHRGRRFVGHLAPAVGRLGRDDRVRLLAQLDLARHLAATPRALALILESVGPDALPLLGRALAQRIGRVLS
jgi:hypothetical protein